MLSKKPTLNVGTIGSVSQGKSTLVKALTGTSTQKFKQEKVRNITIKLGYANAKIYKQISDSSFTSTFNENSSLVKHFSFVDCPGHDAYMSAMISGSSIMDAVIMIIAANEPCPQLQTKEHLKAIQVISDKINPKNLLIVQNKIDLVTRDQAIENYKQIIKFVKGTFMEGVPIIPICAVLGYNMDKVCKHISNFEEQKDEKNGSTMSVIRSFDINIPNIDVKDLKGGVLGGTVLNGQFSVDDEIIIKPQMIKTTIRSLRSEKDVLKTIDKGGLIAIGTDLDPSLTSQDKLIGSVVEKVSDQRWEVFSKMKVSFTYFKSSEIVLDEKEKVVINVGSGKVAAKIKTKGDNLIIKTDKPICSKLGEMISILKNNELVGYGIIIKTENDKSKFTESRAQFTPSKLKFNEHDFLHDLDIIYNKLQENKPDLIERKKKSLQHPHVIKNNNKTVWTNFQKICTSLNRDPKHVYDFFLEELGTTGSIDGEQNFVIKGIFKPNIFEKMLKKYIKHYVSCHSCKSLETIMEKDPNTRMYIKKCKVCESFITVQNISKGYRAIKR